MDSNIYKIIFKGLQNAESKKLTLSFKDIISDTPLKIPSQFILELKRLSEITQNIIYIQNIEQVLIIGNKKPIYSFNYYFLILYTYKKDGKREGFLVGNVKNWGDIVIGLWPFNERQIQAGSEQILDECHNIINNPQEYQNICLIDQ
jgi:hypothetical protein